MHIFHALGLERGFEVKNDKILYYEVGGNAGELLNRCKQERINALVRGINKIIHSKLVTMNTGNDILKDGDKILDGQMGQ